MKKVRRNDYYSIRKNPYFSYFDVRFLLDLYAPLIGASASATYLALQEDAHQEDGDVGTVSSILDSLRLSAGEFEEACSYLEATGLLRTYESKGEDSSFFSFELFPPLSPEEFFDDPLLYGTLLKYLGEDEAKAVARKYAPKPFKKDGMEEVSSSFRERFDPKIEEGYYASQAPNVKIRKRGKVQTGFELGAFLSSLKGLGTDPDRLNQNDLGFVEKVSSLYGLSASSAAEIAAESFTVSSSGAFFDRDKFSYGAQKAAPYAYFHQEKGEKSQVSSETNLAKKIRAMDSMPPAQWLSIKQNGHRPAGSDLRLLQRLSLEMGLPNGVINALVDYCLATCDNALIANYVEKIGATLVREGCKTSRDAMDYLKSTTKKSKAGKETKANQDKTKRPSEVDLPVDEEEEEVSEEELNALFAELDLDHKDKKPKN